jgi:hypothetical protein
MLKNENVEGMRRKMKFLLGLDKEEIKMKYEYHKTTQHIL